MSAPRDDKPTRALPYPDDEDILVDEVAEALGTNPEAIRDVQMAAAVVPVRRRFKLIRDEREALLSEAKEALRSLRAEARAVLSLERPGIVELVSETNVRCLELRIANAETVLLKLEAHERGERG